VAPPQWARGTRAAASPPPGGPGGQGGLGGWHPPRSGGVWGGRPPGRILSVRIWLRARTFRGTIDTWTRIR